jgi:hypothetical protein
MCEMKSIPMDEEIASKGAENIIDFMMKVGDKRMHVDTTEEQKSIPLDKLVSV